MFANSSIFATENQNACQQVMLWQALIVFIAMAVKPASF
jgi:hypothetical protein